MKVDKLNDNVAFNDAEHVYWNLKTNVRYISVTTLIDKFGKPFDKEFWSGYRALEQILTKDQFKIEKPRLLDTKKIDKPYYFETYNIDENNFNAIQQKVLDDWQENNAQSCDRGTKIHASIENGFLDSGICELPSYGLGGKFNVRSGDVPLDEEKGVYPEYLIHVDDGDLHLAGQIDLLIKDGNDLYIYDWKGLPLDTKIPTITGWSTIAELKEGDTIFDKNGEPTKIIHKSEIHHNPCFKITFDNGESITADHEHRWEIAFKTSNGYKMEVMTTEDLYNYSGRTTPKILNPKPLHLPEIELPEDPYLVGSRLGNIPNIYQRASYNQRLQLLRGIMDKCGSYSNHRFVIRKYKEAAKILASLGIKYKTDLKGNIIYATTDFNPFTKKTFTAIASGTRSFRNIINVEPVNIVPTQCLEVDSPTHTFLCTESMIVTHNTNKEIKTKGFFDKKTKTTDKMLYPLHDMDECNFSHYTLQLSMYAWMLQHNNPEFQIKRLRLVHFDHNDNRTEYDIEYKKATVERLLRYWKSCAKIEERKKLREPIKF